MLAVHLDDRWKRLQQTRCGGSGGGGGEGGKHAEICPSLFPSFSLLDPATRKSKLNPR